MLGRTQPTVKWHGAADDPAPGPALLEQIECRRGPRPRPTRALGKEAPETHQRIAAAVVAAGLLGLRPVRQDCRLGLRRPSGSRGWLPCPGTPTMALARGTGRSWVARGERRGTVPGDHAEQTG
ncbi:hypothetical protein NDU88_013332 [Pleurodeles waltl]|uniref:Uncharacterized protein n=1 Tax=Pleurodeles waltl TaxID=8319 RepID=A0AAV7R6G9_PLEWA|nr:hypothetical protein NDU88_013332 [Pleurodeles waltl]